MSNDDTKLRLIHGERVPRTNVIELLEMALAKANAGEVIAVGIVYEYATGEMGCLAAHAEESTPLKMVGELEVLKHLVVSRHCT